MTTTAEAQPEAEPVQNAPTVSSGADNNASTTSGEKQDSTEDSMSADPTRSIQMPDVPPAEEAKQPTSQPMTASSSITSNIPSKDAPSGAAAPVYGTRSRNRGGASRVNYAEDKELDAELEAQAIIREDNPRKRKGASENNSRSNTVEPAPSVAPAKRAAALHDNTNGASQEPAKEKAQIPGTLTFSVNTSASTSATAQPQPAKKRKTNKSSEATPNGANGMHLTPTKNGTPVPRINQSTGKESAMLSFEHTGARLSRHGKLIADDGTALEVNDHVYLVCEPPGEPYYLGRIMEFLHVDNDTKKPVDALRMNWYYRPRDIQRKVTDTRQIFASMHSDISPLTSLRGICTIKHKSEIEDFDEYRRQQNCFWYEKLFDRYIHRYYEVVPTKQVVNVPKRVKTVLDERWRYIIVESGRAKELTSAAKSCKRCNEFCTNATSVDCAVCHRTYHMRCVRPPLLKKPSRGFGWQCGPCSRAQSRKFEARNTPNVAEDGEELEEEDEEMLCAEPDETGATTPMGEEVTPIIPGTEEQIYQASLWPFRYLGIHCKVEDCLDYDDRIYPRAISRLGPKYQADVLPWPGRPVELVPRMEIKKKYGKGGNKKEGRVSKETLAAIEADKLAKENRPKWIEDEPVGYVARGEDYENDDPRCTATLLFKPLETDDEDELKKRDDTINEYVDHEKTKAIAENLGLTHWSTNFLTTAIITLHAADYDIEKALEKLSKVTKKELKEPDLSPTELKKFEDAVCQFGSELLSVRRAVKTVKPATIVRFYYTWKKTPRGKEIWGNYSGRKGKKEAKKISAGRLQDDVADDQDDSAFDNGKAIMKKKGFICKFCSTRSSRQWRRAPQTSPGTTVNVDQNGRISNKEKGTTPVMVALCLNCAIVWRRYAVQWEDSDDKKLGGAAKYKRKAADDPQREFQLSELSWTASNTEAANTPSGTPAPETAPPLAVADAHPKKKIKLSIKEQKKPETEPKPEPEVQVIAPEPIPPAPAPVLVKKKPVEKPLPPPPPPPPPKPVLPPPKILPCAICQQLEPMSDHLSCRECRMSVHRHCYGVSPTRVIDRWTCDTCANDRVPAAFCGYYKCVLCPVESTEHNFVEPPKISHKKKSEKEKEKDRQERELAHKAADFYRQKQEDAGKPVEPREPLKRTQNNHWAHITCAVWTPEIKFGDAKELAPIEGITLIPHMKREEICKCCKSNKAGYCVACHSCKAPMHVECAHQAGYTLGFDISAAKGAKRNDPNAVTIGNETGFMTAAIWCKEHVPTKTIVHRMHDIVDEETGQTALQLYVEKYKQADLSQTGAMRKALMVSIIPAADAIANAPPPIAAVNRRSSTIAASNAVKAAAAAKAEQTNGDAPKTNLGGPCSRCGNSNTPRFYRLRASLNGHISENGRITPPQHDGPKQQVALAAAALNEGSSNEVLCHKCWRQSVKAKPEPPPSPSRVMEIPAQAASNLPQPVLPPPMEPMPGIAPSPAPAPLPILNQHAPPAPLQPQLGAPSWLTHPPPYSPSAAYAGWGGNDRRGSGHVPNGYMPHHSPRQSLPAGPPAMESTPRGMNAVLNHAPHLDSPHIRGGPPPLPVHHHGSPYQSQVPAPGIYRAPSPYGARAGSPYGPRASSPPREMRHAMAPMHHHQQYQPQSHNPYYNSGRPLPQHLPNGGPPPRAQEMAYQRPSMAEEQQRMRDRTQQYYRSALPYPEHPRDREEREAREMREREPRTMEWRDSREMQPRDGDPREMQPREMAPRDPREMQSREVNGYNVHAPPPPPPQQPQVNGIQPAQGLPPRPPQSGTDHRVNGGASASPSLRNLLS